MTGAAFRAAALAALLASAPLSAVAAVPPAHLPLDPARAAPVRLAPVLAWRMLDARAMPSTAARASFDRASIAGDFATAGRSQRSLCAAAADCYAGGWPDRIALRAEQSVAGLERVAPLSAFAAGPFALFSVAAIAWGLARGERPAFARAMGACAAAARRRR